MAKKRVAVLGGGVAAVTAAYEITNAKDWQDHFEVTIYTLGWRLGGKGASGRNAAHSQRIEEHGLHVWLGFYDNAFRMIKEVYAENARPIDAPLATWRAAFRPENDVINIEPITTPGGRHWTFHEMHIPRTDEEPGVGREIPRAADAIRLAWSMFSEWLHGQVPFEVVDVAMSGAADGSDAPPRRPQRAKQARPFAHLWPLHVATDALRMAKDVQHAARALPAAGERADRKALEPLALSLEALRALLRRAFSGWLGRHDYARTLLVYSEFFIASAVGAIRDGVVEHDWDAIDDYEFWEWLSRNGCDAIVRDSAIVRALYDFIFAYPLGDRTRPSCSASTMMRLVTRMWLTGRGAMFWKMNAGMGDTIFAPLYEVLKRRGVRIEFFNKVVDIVPDRYGERVEKIRIERQVLLRGVDEYRPLIDVKGLPCWPGEPDWSQIRDGRAIAERLKKRGVDLESAWCDEKAGDATVLEGGKDFDVVVLGIPVAALPKISQKLMNVDSRFRAMIASSQTVETVSAQIWMQPTLRALGWRGPPVLAAGDAAPLDTYADMAHLLAAEDWQGESVPQDLAYFCGVWKAPPEAPLDDTDYPRRSGERAYRVAADQYREGMPKYWPQATGADGEAPVEWKHLHAAKDAQGEARFAAQYWRANVSPDQRYTLALPGLIKQRLVTNETRFSNLYLAGDWTLNGVDAGTVEGSVMSGMQAAREICGRPKVICGETEGVRTRIARGRGGMRFVDIAAPQQIPGPVGISDMALYAFTLEASRAGALQDYVDRTLNQPCCGAVRYEVMMEHVIAFMASLGKTWSMAPGLHAGWLPEIDCGFWIPVARVSGDAGRRVVEELLLYPVALYVDQPYTEISGREIYGYPKGLGEPRVPRTPEDAGPFWLKTVLMREYDANREFKNEELWRIERESASVAGEVYRDGAGALKLLFATFLGEADRRLPEVRLSSLIKQLRDAPRAMPMVFLKQFRDACSDTRACYQAIVENLSTVTKFDGLGLMPGTYRFKTVPTESVGLMEALGLRQEMKVIFAFWSKFDMVVGPGQLKWEAR